MGKWYQNLKVFEPWQWLIAFSAPILMMDWLRGLAECDELKNNTNGKLKIFSLLTEQKWHEAAFRTTWRWCMNSMLQVWLAKYCKHSTYSLQWCTQDVLGAGAKTIKMAPHVWWGGGHQHAWSCDIFIAKRWHFIMFYLPYGHPRGHFCGIYSNMGESGVTKG